MTEKYLNERQTAEYLGVSLPRLRVDRKAKAGIPFVKFGKRVIYRLSDIEKHLQGVTVEVSSNE